MRVGKIVCALAAIAAPFAANAQSSTDTPPAIGVGLIGGATFPVGNYNKVAATGFHIGGFVDFGRRLGPAGVRADLMYHGFGDKDLVSTGNSTTQVTFSNKYSMVNGTLNLVLGVPMENSAVRPYVIGGVGGYYVRNSPKCSGNFCTGLTITDESATKFGLNAGGGVEFGLGGAAAFLEARYHHILNGSLDPTCIGQTGCNRAAAKLVPLSLGVKMSF